MKKQSIALAILVVVIVAIIILNYHPFMRWYNGQEENIQKTIFTEIFAGLFFGLICGLMINTLENILEFIRPIIAIVIFWFALAGEVFMDIALLIGAWLIGIFFMYLLLYLISSVWRKLTKAQ
jgi:uncharacterized protein YacL